jgi:hypothetical protein
MTICGINIILGKTGGSMIFWRIFQVGVDLLSIPVKLGQFGTIEYLEVDLWRGYYEIESTQFK